MAALSTQLIALGVAPTIADALQTLLLHAATQPEHTWQQAQTLLMQSKLPFAVHEFVYKNIYPDWADIPRPVWFPDPSSIANTHLGALMSELGCATYNELFQWSVTQRGDFWRLMTERLAIQFDQAYTTLLDVSQGVANARWFTGARLNIVNSCFYHDARDEKAIAIIAQDESGRLTHTSYAELDALSNRIAVSIRQRFHVGDRLSIIMPLTRDAIALYLGIIKTGCCVTPIADSFASDEIAKRFKIAGVKGVFCQDVILRDGKEIPLYERVLAADAPCTIVLSPTGSTTTHALRPQDIAWQDFLSENSTFTAHACEPYTTMTILFSSGTTGDPKAIPWDHTTPIKGASDAYLHLDLRAGERFCWPTNLGWMMGPWHIFACLINRATMAIYEGTPNSEAFGRFIQDQQVQLLGVVPTIVKTWRKTACMAQLDWRSIRCCASTGERSNIDDMLYLMSLCHYQPIIEYCGGTEIGGAYITGTLIQPCAPSAFSTPTLGLDFILLNDAGEPTDKGEVALIPPSIGLSTTLLNKDHHHCYYEGMPQTQTYPCLRRHGDEIAHYANGYYRLLGRVDDTMKLAGIKISSAEIEAALLTLPDIEEVAAVASTPSDHGPSQLILFVVLSEPQATLSHLQIRIQETIKQRLNPLFKVHDLLIVDHLPRTASNKVMRRVLREQYEKNRVHD